MNLASYQAYTDYDQYCQEAFSLKFSDYIEFAAHHIAQVRARAKLPAGPDAIAMNTPFEYRPENFQGKQAVLLIHGFITSPYVMKALGKYFAEKGYLVRAVLLPGHGCSPGELLNAKLEHWQKAVDYGVKSLLKEAEAVHICGFSLGATLADLASYRYQLKSLIQIAPAFGISHLSAFLPTLSNIKFSRLLPFLQWSTVSLENNLVSYTAFPLHGAAQVYLAVRALRKLMREKNLNFPRFIAASADDATVKIAACMQFFAENKNALSKMRLYSSKALNLHDPRITLVNSGQLSPKILDISHIAMPVAPEDAYFGQHGSYYGKNQSDYYFGELSRKNLLHRPFKRLTYNPDFYGMLEQIDTFLSGLE